MYEIRRVERKGQTRDAHQHTQPMPTDDSRQLAKQFSFNCQLCCVMENPVIHEAMTHRLNYTDVIAFIMYINSLLDYT